MHLKSNVKSNLIILITLGILFTFSSIITTNYSYNSSNNNGSFGYRDDIAFDNEKLKTSEVSGKIHINGNSGWTTFKGAGKCTGFGTYSQPYVIEDLEIDGGGSGSCILIENSNVYFEIENCTIYNSGGSSGDAGIHLSNLYNGKLINNTISFNQGDGIYLSDCFNIEVLENNVNNNTGHGITIKECENITIGNSTINYNSAGIFIMDIPSGPPYVYGTSVNINILGNEMYNNTSFSIFLYRVDDSQISNNLITHSMFGMCINQVNELQVRNNILLSCTGEGIAPHSGNNINLTENLMTYCGISGISDDYSELSTYSIDTSNKVNGKPVYYYLDSNNLDNADYSNPGQIILVNCNSSNISEISISDTANALTLLYCTNVNISDCNFSDNHFGINLDYSNNNVISRNIINSNRIAGISLSESNNNSIFRNDICNNNNDLEPSKLLGSPPSNKYRYGVGANLYENCDNNSVSENTLTYNNIGVYIFDSSYNTIVDNALEDNYEYGLLIDELGLSESNLIYSNCFISNLIENARDNGTNNQWDNGVKGNYWDDYDGIDADDNGVGDTPYNISGSAGSQDNFPLMKCPISVLDGGGIPIELIILISVISGGAMIGVATILLIIRKRKRIL